MIGFDKALQALGTAEFIAVLKEEIVQLGADHLPLQQGLSNSNYVAETPLTVTINGVAELENVIRVKAGIFFQGVTGGCSCACDPASTGVNEEYCEVQIDIDKATAAIAVALVPE